jgi:hypothetical protein
MPSTGADPSNVGAAAPAPAAGQLLEVVKQAKDGVYALANAVEELDKGQKEIREILLGSVRISQLVMNLCLMMAEDGSSGTIDDIARVLKQREKDTAKNLGKLMGDGRKGNSGK